MSMLSFQEVEVVSVLPFQDLGANFTFCCVAVNREGNTSDMLHSVFSKIPTCSIVEWGTIWLLGTCLYVFPYCLVREVWNRFPRPSVLTGGGRLWHLVLLHALWELLAGQSLVLKAEPCHESFLTAAAQPAVAQPAGVQESHFLLGLFLRQRFWSRDSQTSASSAPGAVCVERGMQEGGLVNPWVLYQELLLVSSSSFGCL